MNKNKKYYAFSRPNQMEGHKFTDDVALCKATSFRQAKKIFSRYYADIKDDEIILISGMLNNGVYGDVIILTDYCNEKGTMTNGEKFKEVFGYECESDCGCGAFYVDFGTDCPVTQGRKCVTECYYNDWINQEYKGEQKNEKRE